MKRIFHFLMLIYTSNTFAQIECPHELALHCPMPDAPLVTELRPGKVKVIYTAEPNGSVSNIIVTELQGDPRWQEPVMTAISKWLYLPGDSPYEQSFLFTAEFSE